MSNTTNAASVANNITDFIITIDDLSKDDYDLALGYVRCEYGHGDAEDKFVAAAIELLRHYQNKKSKE